MSGSQDVATVTQARLETTASRLRELVAHLRHQRAQLREEWARLITEAKLLTAMTKEEIFAEATSVYDNYVEALETGTYEALQAYARNLSERIIPRGVETHEVVGIVLLLRDVLARSLFATYRGLQQAEPDPRRLRACGQPHRGHRGRRLRAGARAHIVPATGGDPRAVDARPQVRRAADPADHRRHRSAARPPADRAAAPRHRTNRAKVVVLDITRRAVHRLAGREPSGADRRGGAAPRRDRDHRLSRNRQTLVNIG